MRAAIAVMVNGIPQNDPEDHNVYWLDFPDIAESLEDIQVQRGAGSAFYGPPAIGGSVNLITKNFGRETILQVSAGLGSYNTRNYCALVFYRRLRRPVCAPCAACRNS